MKGEEESRERAREIRKFEAKQRNAALARKLLKVNSDNDPLWNPLPQAPLIWRVGAGVVGMFFFLFGCGFLCLWHEEHTWGLFTVSALFILVSVLTCFGTQFMVEKQACIPQRFDPRIREIGGHDTYSPYECDIFFHGGWPRSLTTMTREGAPGPSLLGTGDIDTMQGRLQFECRIHL